MDHTSIVGLGYCLERQVWGFVWFQIMQCSPLALITAKLAASHQVGGSSEPGMERHMWVGRTTQFRTLSI